MDSVNSFARVCGEYSIEGTPMGYFSQGNGEISTEGGGEQSAVD